MHIIKCLWLPPKKLSKQEALLWKCHVIFWAPPFISFIFLFNPSGGTSRGPRLKPKSRLQWGRRCGEMRGPPLGVSLFSLIFALFSPASALLTHAPAAVSLCNTLFLLLFQGGEWSVWWRACHTFYMRHLRILATSMLWKDFSECLYHRYARIQCVQWRFPSHFCDSNPPCGVFLCRDRSSWRRTPGESRGGSLPDSTRQWLPPNAMQGDICKP